MTKTYTPVKGLVNGYLIAPHLKGKLVIAVPEKIVHVGLKIEYAGQFMFLKDIEPILQIEFEDKFGRDEKYKLNYYEWKPVKAAEQMQWV